MKTIKSNFSATRIMRLAWILILVCTVAVIPQHALAAVPGTPAASSFPLHTQWVVVVSSEKVKDKTSGFLKYDNLYMVNTLTNEVHGPFLRDEMTPIDEASGTPASSLDAYDIVITPDGKTALISSYYSQKVHIVDISNPLAPVYLSFVQIETDAEDLDITTDGRYGLVTGGGSSTIISSIDIPNRKLAAQLTLPENIMGPEGKPYPGTASGIAVGPDGTVLAIDFQGARIHCLTIDSDGALTYMDTYRYYISYTGDTSLTALPQKESYFEE